MDAFCTQSKNPLHPTRKKHISETNFSFASVNLLSITLHLLAPFYLGMDQEHLNWCTQFATLQKIFLSSKFRYFLSSNSTHKTKTGTAMRWEITHSKEPRAVIMIGK
jgi:hypothetical protein